MCYCDVDPPRVYSSAKRKARKRYRCQECGGSIERGEKYEYVSGLWQGGWEEHRTCGYCLEIRKWLDANYECFRECFSLGDLDQAIEDFIESGKTAPGQIFRAYRFRVQMRRRYEAFKAMKEAA